MNILEEAGRHQERLISLRRDIHRHPELSWKETRTQGVICRELDELGIPYEKVCGTGAVSYTHLCFFSFFPHWRSY